MGSGITPQNKSERRVSSVKSRSGGMSNQASLSRAPHLHSKGPKKCLEDPKRPPLKN